MKKLAIFKSSIKSEKLISKEINSSQHAQHARNIWIKIWNGDMEKNASISQKKSQILFVCSFLRKNEYSAANLNKN